MKTKMLKVLTAAVVALAAIFNDTASADVIQSTIPGSFGQFFSGGIGTFNYTIPQGEAINSANLQLSGLSVDFYPGPANLYIDGELIGQASIFSGSNPLISIPDVSVLSDGQATLSWDYSPGAWSAGSPSVLLYGGGTLTINTALVPEPSTYFAGALLLIPVGIHGYRSIRNRKHVAKTATKIN